VWTSGDSGGRESAPAVRTNREVVAQAVRRSRAPRARRINGGTARSMGWCTAVLTSTIRTHRRAAPGVGLLGGEVSPDQVCGIDGPLTCDGGALPGLGMAPLQAGGAHQPPDPLAGDTDALDHQPARRGRRVHVRPPHQRDDHPGVAARLHQREPVPGGAGEPVQRPRHHHIDLACAHGVQQRSELRARLPAGSRRPRTGSRGH
jgi:hypothetical protein